MGAITIDPFQNAMRDDATEQGVARVESVFGELVRVPFREGHFTLSGSSLGTFRRDQYRLNSDGSNSGISVAVAAGTDASANYTTIKFLVYGRVIGLRWLKGQSTTIPRDFSVKIDGVSYLVPNQIYDPMDGTTLYTTPEGEFGAIIAKDLPDTEHVVEIICNGSADQSNRWAFLGYLAERRVGYTEQPRLDGLCTTTTLTTAMAIPNYGSVASSLAEYKPRGIRGIFYYNTTGAPVTVSVEIASVTFWSKAIPANSTEFLDFGALGISTDLASVTGSNTIKHMASANTSISATVLGVF